MRFFPFTNQLNFYFQVQVVSIYILKKWLSSNTRLSNLSNFELNWHLLCINKTSGHLWSSPCVNVSCLQLVKLNSHHNLPTIFRQTLTSCDKTSPVQICISVIEVLLFVCFYCVHFQISFTVEKWRLFWQMRSSIVLGDPLKEKVSFDQSKERFFRKTIRWFACLAARGRKDFSIF